MKSIFIVRMEKAQLDKGIGHTLVSTAFEPDVNRPVLPPESPSIPASAALEVVPITSKQ